MRLEDFSNEQVIHDTNQLRSPSELKVGKQYRIYNDLPIETRAIPDPVTVVSLDRIAEGWVRIRKFLSIAMLIPGVKSGTGEEDASLRDAGLMPYSEPDSLKGMWNRHYWWIKEK